MSRRRFEGRFSDEAGDPMAAMATLVDVMLVFACGLMAALILGQNAPTKGGEDVERAKTLPNLPAGLGTEGRGYEAVGRVYRDPKTGKLILVESPGRRAADQRREAAR